MDSLEKSVCHSCQRRMEHNLSSGRISNSGSWRRASISLSRDGSGDLLDEIPDECLAQVGDCGPSVESSQNSSSFEMPRRDSFRKMSRRASLRSTDGASEKLEDRILEDLKIEIVAHAGDNSHQITREIFSEGTGSLRFQSDNLCFVENIYLDVNKTAADHGHSNSVSPLPTDVILFAGENVNSSSVTQISNIPFSKEKEDKLAGLLDYLSYLVHLAVFGVLGVLTRYLLKKLFGPDVLSLTSNETPIYPDLLANVMGSFFMGWFGVVFKEDVRYVSDHLAVGLTTGYLGSLTTFSGWNQNMVRLSSEGHWTFAVAGLVIGMWVVDRSIDTGVWTARCLRMYLVQKLKRDPDVGKIAPENWRIDRLELHGVMMALMIVILCCLWGLSGGFARTLLDDLSTGAEIWLACLVGPPGVWSRWYLARLNGQGIGKKGSFKWLPIGTLMANFLAACMMAALATIANAVNTKRCEIIVGGVQLGFMGCLSTVSTFAVEVYAMRQSDRGGRALAYVVVTFITSFALGTLIYSVPVWTKHYH